MAFWGNCALPQVYEGGVTLNEIWDSMRAAADIKDYSFSYGIAKRFGLAWMCSVCVDCTVHPDNKQMPIGPVFKYLTHDEFVLEVDTTDAVPVCKSCYAAWEHANLRFYSDGLFKRQVY